MIGQTQGVAGMDGCLEMLLRKQNIFIKMKIIYLMHQTVFDVSSNDNLIWDESICRTFHTSYIRLFIFRLKWKWKVRKSYRRQHCWNWGWSSSQHHWQTASSSSSSTTSNIVIAISNRFNNTIVTSVIVIDIYIIITVVVTDIPLYRHYHRHH